MKKALLIIAVAALGAIGAYAQGTVSFSAGVGKMGYTLTPGGTNYTAVPAGHPDSIGFTVTFYSTTSGTVLGLTSQGVPDFTTGGWAEATTLINNVAPAAGAVPTSSVTLAAASGSPGATEELEMVAWTGNYADFATAVADGAAVAWTGGVTGGALGWSQATGTATSPAAATVGTGGYSGSLDLAPVGSVPEPGTLALGGLGAAALLLFRRRK